MNDEEPKAELRNSDPTSSVCRQSYGFYILCFSYQFKPCFSKVFLVTENQELLSRVHLDLSPPTKKKKTAFMHNHYIANTFKGQTDLSAFYIVNLITF